MSSSEIRIFIASPGDCSAEREAVRRIIREDASIRYLCNNLKIAIKDLGWEDVHSELGRPQSLINAEIEKFAPDWFIFIFWHRIGSDAGMGMTGSEEEWELARRMHEKGNGHPWVSLYFNNESVNLFEIDSIQLEKLKNFRDKVFTEYQGLAKAFNGVKEFEDIFRSHVIRKILDNHAIDEKKPLGVNSVKNEFLESSKSLLTWPRTFKNGVEIKRDEFDVILNKIKLSDSSTILIIGGPGTGKSSLMASLTQYFVDQNIAMLAIKADMLETQIDSRSKLSKWLSLTLDILDAVKYLASNEMVVVLIDQLDALSELLDRKSERLNILLNLIQSLSGLKNVHIIATSREFEYRHDIRLANIEAERIVLQLPSWEEIQQILTSSGYQVETFSEAFREILRTPLHLKIYLDIIKPGVLSIASLQVLLERLWERNILGSTEAKKQVALLERLASSMADNEVLWLPIATCDEYISEKNSLLQADILTKGSNDMVIGFRHQTYYDYTLARAFARGTIVLSEYIIQRQDGLFIRPVLLTSLNYLRETHSSEYHNQLKQLLESNLRSHIRMLILEFLGEQKNPDDFEASIILPLLRFEESGHKILSLIASSPGWFWRIYHTGILNEWMMKDSTEAAYCASLLFSSINIASNEILDLIQVNWLSNGAYDSLSINVLSNLNNWNTKAIEVLSIIVRRDYIWEVENIVEKLIISDPDNAMMIVSIDLQRRLKLALIEIENTEKPDISKMSEEEQIAHYFAYNPVKPIERIIEDQNVWYNIEDYAEACPKLFIKWVWPWFIELVSNIANVGNPFINRYKTDQVTNERFSDDSNKPIISAIYAAVIRLAETDHIEFKEFVKNNECLEYMIVHRIICHGLIHIVNDDSSFVLKYLISDARRLMIGNYNDNQYETKKIIAAIYPVLSNNEKTILDDTILNLKKYKEKKKDWSIKDRFQRQKWERQDRLRLLRVIPKDCISPNIRRTISEEERALPDTDDGESNITVGSVGPRLIVSEMQKSLDKDILNLFNELSDNTGWDNPARARRFSDDYSRSGGVIQLSREFFEFAKADPERAIKLMIQLTPLKNEMYVSKGVEGIEEANIPSDSLFSLIMDFNRKGFNTVEFYDGISSALEKRAEKDDGLPDEILLMLQEWLGKCNEPVVREITKTDKHRSILFDNITYTLPNGRGNIFRAISLGYLMRNPSGTDNWISVVEKMFNYEQNPEIWASVLRYISYAFAYDKTIATKLLDKIIKKYPDALQYNISVYAIARNMRFCGQSTMVRDWLDMLVSIDSPFCHQVYGEMSLIYYAWQSDDWIVNQVNSYIESSSDNDVLIGIAYSAVNMWKHMGCQGFATEVICQLLTKNHDEIQNIISSFFRLNYDSIILNSNSYKIIEAISVHKKCIIRCADSLLELMMNFIQLDANLVLKVCRNVLDAAGCKLNDYTNSLASCAETLTNIALTLHRIPEYRESGLEIFERLLELDIRETRAALEVLDRKPIRKMSDQYLRRVRRKRKNSYKHN